MSLQLPGFVSGHQVDGIKHMSVPQKLLATPKHLCKICACCKCAKQLLEWNAGAP